MVNTESNYHRDEDISTAFLIGEAIQSLFKPRQLTKPPTDAVYRNRPSNPMTNYVVTAIIFTSLALFLGLGEIWMTYLGFSLGGYVAPIFYLIWMVRSDRFEREPLALIMYVFGWGAFSTIIASILNVTLALPILGAPGAAFVEEPLKIFGVYVLAKNKKVGQELNDHLDGMVYGAAAGAGFAGVENIYYIFQMVNSGGVPPLAAIIIRSTTAFGHIAWSAMVGRTIGLAKALRGHIHIFDCIPGLIVSISLHFLWNYLSPIISLGIILPFTIYSLTRQVRTAIADERHWGYSYQAPTET